MIQWFSKHMNYLTDFEKIMQTRNEDPTDSISKVLADNRGSKYKIPLVGKIILVIDKDKKLVAGSAVAELETSGKVYISNVYVKPEFRGQKICQTLVKQLIDSYPADTQFLLDVRKSNIGAVKCYEHNGFKVTVEKHFFKNGEKINYYVMSKP
jgi:ribosomal protein S18 acetylase RimI-like enzyme